MLKHSYAILLILIASSQTLPTFSQTNQLQRIKLNWNSFVKVQKNNRPYIAYTTHKTMYKYRATQTGNQISLKFQVNVTLDTPKTLVDVNRLKALDETSRTALLNHEQGHTDLAVIYGRELYKRLSRQTYTINDYKVKTRSIYTRLMKELADLNFKYDVETEHGFDTEQQLKWEQDLKKRWK